MTETTPRDSFSHDQTKHVQNGGWMWRGGECLNPASPFEIAKTQSDKRYKLLSLSKTEYFVPKKVHMSSPRQTLQSPGQSPPLPKGLKVDTKPKTECNCYSNFQLHSSAICEYHDTA